MSKSDSHTNTHIQPKKSRQESKSFSSRTDNVICFRQIRFNRIGKLFYHHMLILILFILLRAICFSTQFLRLISLGSSAQRLPPNTQKNALSAENSLSEMVSGCNFKHLSKQKSFNAMKLKQREAKRVFNLFFQ